ncbi:hypothetical protein ACLQ2R_29785 [Streptosporangium sp. DT93]|uniref:hypothetical protein n=1 Tax=Streptosporangium sp. DT93 TaxID=3393428 RepID=UPI003CF3ED2B
MVVARRRDAARDLFDVTDDRQAPLGLTPPVHASPDGSCRGPNLLSDATFPDGTDIKPRYLPHGAGFVGRVCGNGRWREYWRPPHPGTTSPKVNGLTTGHDHRLGAVSQNCGIGTRLRNLT